MWIEGEKWREKKFEKKIFKIIFTHEISDDVSWYVYKVNVQITSLLAIFDVLTLPPHDFHIFTPFFWKKKKNGDI